jgi:hypothetical protein
MRVACRATRRMFVHIRCQDQPKDNMKVSNIQEVQDKFLAAVAKDGLVHTLQWIGTWYDRAAEAAAEDELQRGLGEFAGDSEARELALLDHLLPNSERVSNYSTSAGHNLYQQAMLAAQARLLNQLIDGKVGPAGRRRQWADVRARLQGAKAEQQPGQAVGK